MPVPFGDGHICRVSMRENIIELELAGISVTLAPAATLLGLAIHLYDPDHLLGNKTNIGITLCLIPTSHPGCETYHVIFPCGQHS